MNKRTKHLKELVQESFYEVDPHAVADAIVRRAARRQPIPRCGPIGVSARDRFD
jgi:hypothetical protein